MQALANFGCYRFTFLLILLTLFVTTGAGSLVMLPSMVDIADCGLFRG